MKSFTITKLAYVLILSCIFISLKSQDYPPSSVVVEPINNAYYKSGSDITIKVYASDIGKNENNGLVSKVEFYSNGIKLGESTSGTNNYFTFIWENVATGTYQITATATNSQDVSFTSVKSIITVGVEEQESYGLSTGKGKYLGNIIPHAAQINFDTYWNSVTSENGCKLGAVEGTRDKMNWNNADVAYNYATEKHMFFRYNSVIWASGNPAWFYQLSSTDVRAEVIEYMEAIADRYPLTEQVIVLNEIIGSHAIDNQYIRNILSGIQGCPEDNHEWQIWLYEQARSIFPNSKLILNDFGLFGDEIAIEKYMSIVKALRDHGLIDGIGVQSHYFKVETITPETLQTSLDLLATAGVPIYITELDMRGNVLSENNDQQQLASYETYFPILWEHPAVAEISLWGYVTNQTWVTGIGLVNTDGTEKSAMVWLRDYLNSQPNVGYPGYSDIIYPPISLKSGWNIIGCPVDGNPQISDALSSIWDKVKSIKNSESFYYSNQPEYLNSLKTFEWGEGYLIELSENCNLQWSPLTK